LWDLSGLTSEAVSSQILCQLERLELDYRHLLVGQGYDGASVMSGRQNGVAKLIKDKAILTLYIHCHAHRLNLALVDVVKSVKAAAEFFALMDKLYAFVSQWFLRRQQMG